MDYLSDTSTHHAAARPMSVKEIAARAIDFDYNPVVPLRYWLQTANTLLREATIYQAEGNEQQAYLLLLRQAELLIRHLPDHPEASKAENARFLLHGKAGLLEAVKRLEYLKPRIHARYESYIAHEKSREESYARRQTPTSQIPSETPYSAAAAQSLQSGSSRRTGVPKPLDFSRGSRGSISSGPFSPPFDKAQNSAGLNRSNKDALALEIAKQEFERRETVKRQRRRQVAEEQGRGTPLDSRGREIRRISTPVEDSSYRKKYSTDQYGDNGYGPAYVDHGSYQRRESEEERKRREREQEEEEFDLAQSIEALHMKPELTYQQMQPAPYVHRDSIRFSTASYDDWDQSFAEKREREKHVGNWQYNYPSVPKRRTSPAPFPPMGPPPLPSPASSNITIRSVTPTPPPKPPTFYDGALYSLPPPPPTPPAPPAPPVLPTIPIKTLSSSSAASQKKTDKPFQFTTPATLENGTALRTIFLPSTLRREFLDVAASNTRKNLETCGILCGTLIQNALFISRLVIPEQEATSDTCGTTDEEGLFMYCNSEDLMVLGWIHTHPTQTCFMSSVDLHTHCSYQLMLPESIAIVCAPRFEPSWGVFRLTDPPGVKAIMNCRNKGLFHPHDQEFIYTDAMRPGHVCEVREMGFDVVDLRKDRS